MTPASQAVKIRRLGRKEMESVASLLAQAFESDPVYAYVFPRERTRRRWLQRFFRVLSRFAGDYGLVYGVDEGEGHGGGIGAAAIWFTPERPVPPPWYRQLLPSLELAPLVFLPRSFVRHERLGRMLRGLRPELDRYWYLGGLAVHPAERGRSLGRFLVEDGLARAARNDGRPVFVHAWSSTVAYYERLGFSTVCEGSLRGCDDRCYGMVCKLR